jgi:NADPH2:quinone reductase
VRAAQIHTLDGPAAVRVVDLPDPEPGPDQVLIEVAAAGVCYPDVLLTRGLYQVKPDLPFVPGSEVAGTVLSAPAGAAVAAGDRVAAFPLLGGFAERVAVPLPLVFGLGPREVPFPQAAALPMNYLTVHFALTRRAGLQPGETVLVHGGAGGIGTAAIQLANALGARTIAVASTPQKQDVARAAGASAAVAADGFLAAVRELTDGRGADVVVDPVGGDRFTDSLRALAPEGRLLVIGFTGGEIPTVKVNRLLLTNVSVVGVGWGAYALGRPEFLRQQWAELLPHLAAGALDPPIQAVHPLADVGAALAGMEERRVLGKIVIGM